MHTLARRAVVAFAIILARRIGAYAPQPRTDVAIRLGVCPAATAYHECDQDISAGLNAARKNKKRHKIHQKGCPCWREDFHPLSGSDPRCCQPQQLRAASQAYLLPSERYLLIASRPNSKQKKMFFTLFFQLQQSGCPGRQWLSWTTMSSRKISLVAHNAISHKNTPLSALDTESPAERKAREKAEQQQRATLRTAEGRRVQTFMNRRQAVIDLRQNNPDEFREKVRKCSAHTGNACPRSHRCCCTLTTLA